MIPPPSAAPADLSCECLVIGSGAGGAVTADWLASRGHDVLVIEEGPDPERAVADASVTATLPALWRDGSVIPVRSNSTLALGEGRCLGGSTVVNAGLIHRLPDAITERWRAQGVADLDPAALAGHHDAIERRLRAREILGDPGPAGRLLEEGARRCGFHGSRVKVAADDLDGRLRKNDARRTFLACAARSGARLLPDCSAIRIRFAGAHAEHVEVQFGPASAGPRPGRVRFRWLFLCAGALQSPLLLRRSGVTTRVGDNLHLHPMLRVVAEFPDPVDAHAWPMPSFQIDEFAPRIRLGASVSAPSYTAASLTANWEHARSHLGALRAMASYYVSVAADAPGSVRPLPFSSAYVVRYRIDEATLRDLCGGLARLAEVLFAAGALRIFPAIEGAPPLVDPRGAVALADSSPHPQRLNLTAVHAIGTCPMGEDAARTPVDSHGRLRGFRNVFVNDASVLPTSPGVNPQGPIMAIARRNLEATFP